MIRLLRYAPYLWYPLTLTAAVACFALLLGEHVSIAAALYASIGLVAATVVALQWRFPERREWRPQPNAVRSDIAFMAIVQVALPEALAAGCAVALSASVPPELRDSVWPHAWPVAAQVCLMLALVDFMRYWLHRACHRVPLLWRLHAVHHSPDVLYSLNSGRFHPLEKALHFCVDTVPFLALGVAPEVIAGYFLLYAANGLFQHSNVRLRYGWLNAIVGSAETHRWHHARNPRDAACNFGTTTVIWDVVFGTWRLPGRRRLRDIGFADPTYPVTFVEQLFAPLGLKRGAIRRAVRRRVADLLIKCHLGLTLLIQSRRIAKLARDPMAAQHAVLARILRGNRETAFGRRHRFAAITDYEGFVSRVPVADYEALRPYIDAEIERGERALTEAFPERYVRTSGSTGKPKDIPLTREHLASLRRIHETSVAFQFRRCPEAFAGSILAIVSPACEGVLASGKPYGSASGIVAADTPALVQQKFVVPAEVFAIADSRLKYLLILRLALPCRDLSYIGTANSTTLLTLIMLYRRYCNELIDDLRRGSFFMADALPVSVVRAVGHRLDACPDRAGELAALHGRVAEARISDLWPELRAVVTWTCASAGTTVGALRRELGANTRVLELGYVASEFRGTVMLGGCKAGGLPTLDSNFFEFVERDRWDRGEPEFLTLDRLRKGIDYYIIVTTLSGLYRYFINDLVRVSGFLHRTPLLEFVQKGKGVTSITGEKLYESQMLDAVAAAMTEARCAPRFVMMLADEDARAYRLYVEPDGPPPLDAANLAASVDAKLARLNIEYRTKRESARLGPIDAHWLVAQAGDAYKQFCVTNGQREGQFKTIALDYRRRFAFDFDPFLAAA